MYNYPHYKEQDKEKVLEFMRQHPFVMLIATDKNGRIEATQIPVLIDERDGKIFLCGHIARKMTHEKALEQNLNALIIFTGAHTYVSGTYYTGNLQQASTWNYISIHARGEMKWMDEEGLIAFLKRFTLYFEKGNTSSTTIYDNLPEEYLSKLRKAIIGFEMEVTELENVHKLSQNRDEKSYDNIVTQLKQQEGDGKIIGELMEQRKGKVFGQ
ncbi:MAG: FMN-binding negative transcriptional regulator [Bacteroidota bacterium]